MLSLPIALLLACAGEPAGAPVEPGGTAEPRAAICENFQIQSPGGATDPQLAAACERLLSELRTQWFAMEETAWRPRCQLVIHHDKEAYLQAVGSGGREPVGSSRIQLERGRVVSRRIDLLAASGDDALQHLRHELIHVLFAERFPVPPPRWAEEGLALLADTAEKQDRHRRDLRYAIRNDETIPLPAMLSAQEYPSGWQRAVFYGQSLALVEYLVERDSPRSFIKFVEVASKVGYDQALRDVYQVRDLAALRHLWRANMQTSLAEAD